MSLPHPPAPLTRRSALKLSALVAAAAAACGQAPAADPTAIPTAAPTTGAGMDMGMGGGMGGGQGARPTPRPRATAAAAGPAPTAVVVPTANAPAAAGAALEVIALNRLAFGPRPSDLAEWRAQGGEPAGMLAAWLEAQLNPAAIDDSEMEARLAEAGLSTLAKSPEQVWQDHVVGNAMNDDEDWQRYIQPMTETVTATLIRMTHSRRQLFEVLVDFWHNHFNVFRETDNTPPVFLSYDRDVIRAHALGNFRDLLEAVAASPAMLYYLDNANNQVAGPNENFARELFELHTLGAENYLGVANPAGVEKLSSGLAVGYVDNDVYEAARCFTGWRVADDYGEWDAVVPNTGTFYYYRAWHDRFNKLVLGQYLPPDQSDLEDGRQVLRLLATHPGTARFIARKLCRRLVSDQPPDDLVAHAAEVFLAAQDAPDQLKQVVRAIVLSEAFQQTWGEKIKRPLEAAVSLLRALEVDLRAVPDSLYWYLDGLGQAPFGRRPPDGYPDKREAWANTMGLLTRWNFSVALVEGWIGDERGRSLQVDVRAQTPAELHTAYELVDYWANRLLGRPLPPEDREAVAAFMAGEFSPEAALDEDYLAWRLKGLVELIAMSPEFHLR